MQKQIFLAAAAAFQIGYAHAEALPHPVTAYVNDTKATCTQFGGKPTSGPNVEHGKLVTGPEFWAIDQNSITCEGAWSAFGGPHGSEVAVFLALPDGKFKQSTIQGAYGVKVEDVGRASKLWISVAGRNCGQKGEFVTATQIACDRDLIWDATSQKLDFAPLSQAFFPDQKTRASQVAPVLGDKPGFYQPAVHNGSEMRLVQWDDGQVQISYVAPRPDLHIAEGTVLFRGTAKGMRYTGTAYTFKSGCEPAPYPVTGERNDKNETIVLTGPAPTRLPNSCDVAGASTQSKNARLVFDIHIDGDE